MVNFENTEVAFRSKNDRQLDRSYLIFKVIANKNLVKTGSLLISAASGIHLPINWVVKPTIFRQFCGGETLQESVKTVDCLIKFGVKSVLDYSVEAKENPAEIEAAYKETLRTVENAGFNPSIAYSVFKPSALIKKSVLEKLSSNKPLSDVEKEYANRFNFYFNALCNKAYELNIPIMVDAEYSYFQDYLDKTTDSMMAKYNHEKAIVFNTFQFYRTDRLEFLKESSKKAEAGKYFLGVKLVRGAYMEQERERAAKMGYVSPIQPDKPATDSAFNDALTFCMDHIDKITIFSGTHNEESNFHLVKLLEAKGLSNGDERVMFAQLFGMSDHISFNLAEEGYNVSKYLPYGPIKCVLPYLIRRAEENTSVAKQTGRELSLIIKEKQRRSELHKKKGDDYREPQTGI